MKVKTNISPVQYPPIITASQDDVGRSITVHLTDGHSKYTPEAGSTAIIHGTKPSGLGFTVGCEIDGDEVSFATTQEMTDEPGRIPCEIVLTAGDVKIATTNICMVIEASPHPEGTTDGTAEHLVSEITALVERAEEAASKLTNATAEAETLPAGSEATADYDDAEGKFIFGIPAGDRGPEGPRGLKGDKGDPGADGFTPSARVSKSGDTATITITDKTGTTTSQVKDGKDGKDGAPGEDGFSPTASVTKSGKTATITITDKNGTTTETVSDGDKGDPGTAATIRVGSVTKGDEAHVTNVGTNTAAVFDFVLPKGDKGNAGEDGYSPRATVAKSGKTATITIVDKMGTTQATIEDGNQGSPGQPGSAATIRVGNVTSGQTPTVTNTGTTTDAVFDFVLVPGETPVRGVDYWTAADKQSVVDDVLAEMINAETTGL